VRTVRFSRAIGAAVALGVAVGVVFSTGAAASADDPPLVNAGSVYVDQAVEQHSASGGTTESWTPTPDAVTYQWYFNDVAISRATFDSYIVPVGDAGGTLRLDVTATKAGYAPTTLSSAETTVLASMTKGPTTLGPQPFKAGHAITVDTENWLPAGTTFTYNWVNLDDNTDSYTPPFGNSSGVEVQVIGHYPGYEDAEIDLTTGPIGPSVIEPAVPTIGGSTNKYNTITAIPNAASWDPAPSSFDYQWNRDGEPIPGATGWTYLLPASSVSHKISVTVTGHADGYDPVASTSAAVRISSGYAFPRPTILGTAKIGHALHVDWSPPTVGKHYSYGFDWYVDGVQDIAETNWDGNELFPTSASDVGKKVTVSVNINFSSSSVQDQETEQSRPTAQVADLVSGRLRPGRIRIEAFVNLPAEPLYSGPSGVASYAWSIGGHPVSTDAYFAPTAAEWHKYLKVAVTVTTPTYGSVVTTSPATYIRTGFFSGSPWLLGTPEVGSTLSVSQIFLSPTPTASKVYWYTGRSIAGTHKQIGTGSTFVVPAADAGKWIFADDHITGLHVENEHRELAAVLITAAAPESREG
jgi:hypothetical protein